MTYTGKFRTVNSLENIIKIPTFSWEITKEKLMLDNENLEKLNEQILVELRLSNDMMATLIRTLVVKGVFSQQDFLRQSAFGKNMDLFDKIFGFNKI